MITWYMVTLNGVPLKRWMTRAEAEAMAERWQGSHGSYHGASGLLKQKDRGDHVEVKEDREANRETNERYREMKAGNLQKIMVTQRVDSIADADDLVKG